MFEERVRSVIGPKGCPHGGNRDIARLAIVLNEGNHFISNVRIELRLHPAAMKWMRALVVKSRGVHRVDAEKLHAPGVNQRRQTSDQSLALKFPLIAGAGGESKQRRSPVAVNNNPHIQSQPIRIPAMIFPFHVTPVDGPRFVRARSRARYYTAFKRAEYWKLYASKFLLCYSNGNANNVSPLLRSSRKRCPALIAESQGQLRKHEKYRSRFLPRTRDLIVYLPPGYEENSQSRYPVLYLQDGQNLFDPATSFIPGMDWHVKDTADQLIAQGAIRPLIIVGIYNTGKWRLGEYTPSRDKKMGGGKADRYGQMLLEEIKPFVESQYRTLGGPANTGLGGSSLGGLLTIYLGLRFPQVFGKLAVLSPSVWWNRGWILNFVARVNLQSRPRIWLDVGTKEGGRSAENVQRLCASLVEKGWREGRDLHFEVISGAEHNEAAWAQRVAPFLQFLFPSGESAV